MFPQIFGQTSKQSFQALPAGHNLATTTAPAGMSLFRASSFLVFFQQNANVVIQGTLSWWLGLVVWDWIL